jgi:hypothetical protein
VAKITAGVVDTGGAPCEYLSEFHNDPMLFSRALGEDDTWKKAKNLVTLPL